MKGFRGIRQPGKDRVHEQSGEHRTAEDKNNMSMSTFSVNKKRVLASRKWIITAACGVGPCYMDKSARIGIRMVDLLDAEDFELKLRHLVKEKNRVIEQVYGGQPVDVEEILQAHDGASEQGREVVQSICITGTGNPDDGRAHVVGGGGYS